MFLRIIRYICVVILTATGGLHMKRWNQFEFEAEALEFENMYNEENDRRGGRELSSIWYT